VLDVVGVGGEALPEPGAVQGGRVVALGVETAEGVMVSLPALLPDEGLERVGLAAGEGGSGDRDRG
jgi:hypothetical protein